LGKRQFKSKAWRYVWIAFTLLCAAMFSVFLAHCVQAFEHGGGLGMFAYVVYAVGSLVLCICTFSVLCMGRSFALLLASCAVNLIGFLYFIFHVVNSQMHG